MDASCWSCTICQASLHWRPQSSLGHCRKSCRRCKQAICLQGIKGRVYSCVCQAECAAACSSCCCGCAAQQGVFNTCLCHNVTPLYGVLLGSRCVPGSPQYMVVHRLSWLHEQDVAPVHGIGCMTSIPHLNVAGTHRWFPGLSVCLLGVYL